MTDDELSTLLQEWKRTPAPASLSRRVFGSPKPPSPSWWDRIPGSLVALTGAGAGVLGVWGLSTLTLTHESLSTPPPMARPAATVPTPNVQPPPETKPATQNRKTKPIKVSVSPRLLSGPVPIYPADASLPLITTVKLRIRIGKDGHVVDASVIEGDPLLEAFAIKAVMAWFYEPGLVNGQPAEASTEVTVTFEPKPKKK